MSLNILYNRQLRLEMLLVYVDVIFMEQRLFYSNGDNNNTNVITLVRGLINA